MRSLSRPLERAAEALREPAASTDTISESGRQVAAVLKAAAAERRAHPPAAMRPPRFESGRPSRVSKAAIAVNSVGLPPVLPPAHRNPPHPVGRGHLNFNFMNTTGAVQPLRTVSKQVLRPDLAADAA